MKRTLRLSPVCISSMRKNPVFLHAPPFLLRKKCAEAIGSPAVHILNRLLERQRDEDNYDPEIASNIKWSQNVSAHLRYWVSDHRLNVKETTLNTSRCPKHLSHFTSPGRMIYSLLGIGTGRHQPSLGEALHILQ